MIFLLESGMKTINRTIRNMNLNKLYVRVDQLSSLSFKEPENTKLVYTMRDLPPRTGHTFPRREMHVMDKDLGGRTRSHSPDTPTFMRRVRRNLQGSEPDLLHRCHFTSQSYLESPHSPSRAKSPWSKLDPYDSPEVMFEIFKSVLRQTCNMFLSL